MTLTTERRNFFWNIKMRKITFSLLIGISIVLLFSGCVIVTITDDLQNPFIITMTWYYGENAEKGETLLPDPETGELPVQTLEGNGAVVEATVEDEYGAPVIDATYEWYLNGELKQTGKNNMYEISGTLEIGSYWLDLVVGKGEVLSSEHLEFVKEE
jgi:hypothetical protein